MSAPARIAKSAMRNVSLVGLANYRRRSGRRADWPSCAACSRFALSPQPMYAVHKVREGDRFIDILGICKIHGEECLRIDFERRPSDSDLAAAWRQLVFHEGELAR